MGNCVSYENQICNSKDVQTESLTPGDQSIVDLAISENKELDSNQIEELEQLSYQDFKEKNGIKEIFDKKVLFSPKAKHRIFSCEFRDQYYIQEKGDETKSP